ncbi:unnamed protein product [Ectocarpus sp. 12 AP-2014]
MMAGDSALWRRCTAAPMGENLFTLLDLPSAYHELSIKEADCHKTVFINARGRLYGFTRCSFGLTMIPAVFSAHLGDTRRPVEVRSVPACSGGQQAEFGRDIHFYSSCLCSHTLQRGPRAASNAGWTTSCCTVEEHLALIEEVFDLLQEAGYSEVHVLLVGGGTPGSHGRPCRKWRYRRRMGRCDRS